MTTEPKKQDSGQDLETYQRIRHAIGETNDVATRLAAIKTIVDQWRPETVLPPVDHGFRHVAEFSDASIARVRARASGEETPVSLPWSGLEFIHGGGLWPGLHVLSAGTGVGKTQLSLQIAWHAARSGVFVGYGGLELDPFQIDCRLASFEAEKTPWSEWFLGRSDRPGFNSESHREDRIARFVKAKARIDRLPIYCDFARPFAWTVERLAALVEHVRAREPDPKKPVLVILDFLQLVGSDPAERLDLRERISRASYAGRALSVAHNAAIVLISSIGRSAYMPGDLAAVVSGATLEDREGGSPDALLARPEALVGVSKESGDVEFSADTLTFLAAIPGIRREGNLWLDRTKSTPVFVGTPKVRAGRPRWTLLGFNGTRFFNGDHRPGAQIEGGEGLLRIYQKVHDIGQMSVREFEKKRTPKDSNEMKKVDSREPNGASRTRRAELDELLRDSEFSTRGSR